MSDEGQRQEPLGFLHPTSPCVPLILKLGLRCSYHLSLCTEEHAKIRSRTDAFSSCICSRSLFASSDRFRRSISLLSSAALPAALSPSISLLRIVSLSLRR